MVRLSQAIKEKRVYSKNEQLTSLYDTRLSVKYDIIVFYKNIAQ